MQLGERLSVKLEAYNFHLWWYYITEGYGDNIYRTIQGRIGSSKQSRVQGNIEGRLSVYIWQ